MPKTGRFYVSQDDSGHEYVIPWERRVEWENYIDALSGGYSEAIYDDVPDYAIRVDGGVVTFMNWKIK